MAIHYTLQRNMLTATNGDYVARVHPFRTVARAEVAEMIRDKGSSLTLADINGVLLLLVDVCAQAVASGSAVMLDEFVEFTPSIRGSFQGYEDGFDRSRHTLTVNATPTAAFKTNVVQRASVEKHEANDQSPSVTTVFDLATTSSDTTLSAGNIAEVSGYRLKFDPDREDEGVFLVAEDGSDTHRVAFVHHNKPRKVIFLVPQGLSAATYYIEVRARSNPNAKMRTGRLDVALAYA